MTGIFSGIPVIFMGNEIMPKFTFVVEATISLGIEVEADNQAEAIKKAKNSSVRSLCYQCSKSKPGEWSTSGELDCDPASSELVEAWEEGNVKTIPFAKTFSLWNEDPEEDKEITVDPKESLQ